MGNFSSARGLSRSFEQRFWEKVKISDGCWEWDGGLFDDGYGAFSMSNRITRRAHRVSYERFKGEIGDGLVVMHMCDNPLCVRPSHLVTGTPADNNADRVSKGRGCSGDHHFLRRHPEASKIAFRPGESNPVARYTEKTVLTIRHLYATGELVSKRSGVPVLLSTKPNS